jgi:hypothetical protein
LDKNAYSGTHAPVKKLSSANMELSNVNPLVPPYVSAELIAYLDTQLISLQCCSVHVAPGPLLVGVSWELPDFVPLEHPELSSYLQAELIAQRVNALLCSSDYERSQVVAAKAIRP